MPLYFLHAGQTGNPVNLYANYFKVESSPDWQMYQYHVDFNPPIDSRKMRKGMLYDHAQKLFKAHLFDGMMLFTNSKLDEVCHLFVFFFFWYGFVRKHPFLQSASSDLISNRHLFLSCAISHTSPLFTPILSKSLSMFFIHVNLRAPLAILSGLSYSPIDILIGVASFCVRFE